MTYLVVVVSFTLGFMFSAVLGRNKLCTDCEINKEQKNWYQKNR